MSQADYGIALTFFVITAAFTMFQRFGPLRSERLKVDRYRLFAIRDRLVLLVASDKIREEDEVFQFLYGNLNRILPRAKPLTLLALVNALNESEFQKFRIDEKFRTHFLDAVNHHDPVVRAVARDLFQVLARILCNRSYFVWASASWTHNGIKLATRCRELLSPLFRKEFEAYQYHQTVQSLAAAVNHHRQPAHALAAAV
jgi:hypothetical protein